MYDRTAAAAAGDRATGHVVRRRPYRTCMKLIDDGRNVTQYVDDGGGGERSRRRLAGARLRVSSSFSHKLNLDWPEGWREEK